MTASRWFLILVCLFALSVPAVSQALGTDLIASDWNGALYRMPPSGPMTTIGTFGRIMWSMTVDADNQHVVAAISASGGFLARIDPATGAVTTIRSVTSPYHVSLDQDGDYLVGTLGKSLLKVTRDGSAVSTVLAGQPAVPVPLRDKDSGDWILYNNKNQLVRYPHDWSSVLTTITHTSLYIYEMVQDPQTPDIYLAASNLARFDPRKNTVSVLAAIHPGGLGDRGIVTDRAPGAQSAMIYLSSPVVTTPTTHSSVLRLDRSGTVLGTVATLPAPVTGIVFDRSRNLASRLRTIGNDRLIQVSFPGDAGKAYAVALGLSGYYPGVKLPDGRVISLNIDPLVTLTAGKSLPPFFTGNVGTLNTTGQAFVVLNTNKLPLPPGLTIWAVALTLDKSAPLGISQISAPLLIVL